MNNILRKITNEMYENENDYFYKKVGNYSVVRDAKNNYYIKHYYYGNVICYVDLDRKHFQLHHCGYSKNPLTTAQLNYLQKFYLEKGFKLIYRGA